jgi:hypothetical protein
MKNWPMIIPGQREERGAGIILVGRTISGGMWWDLNTFVKEKREGLCLRPTKKLKRDEIHQLSRGMIKRVEGNGTPEVE